MNQLRNFLDAMRRKMTLTPEQAETLATIKFPCC
jgi:hypothetical protein